MKKYCLTKCFKKKLSKLQEVIIATIILLGIILIALVIISILFYGIGYGIQYLGYWTDKDMFDIGIITTLIIGVISFAVYWGYIFIKEASKSLYIFTINRIEGEKFECSIFEECKEELDDSK